VLLTKYFILFSFSSNINVVLSLADLTTIFDVSTGLNPVPSGFDIFSY